MLDLVLVLCRLLLGGVLLVASVAKLRDVAGFEASVRAFGLLPSGSVRLVARAIPLLELVCGGLLLLGLPPVAASLGAAFLLLAFTLGIAMNLGRGRRTPCACFGASSDEPLGPAALIRNMLLLAAATGVVVAALARLRLLGSGSTWSAS